jgi:hypothetical protein
MKVGDLVSIEQVRTPDGIPKGTLAMIIGRAGEKDWKGEQTLFSDLYFVEIIGSPRNGNSPRRYFSDDLVVIYAA